MCDAIVRTARMANLQKQTEMICSPILGGNSKDCRPRFIKAANAAVCIGNSGFGPIRETEEGVYLQEFIKAPFINMSKADIASIALELGVPLHLTWSCYKGGEKHCGRCGTCVERLEAIHEAQTALLVEGVADPKYVDKTEYEDTEFWKQAVREAKANG